MAHENLPVNVEDDSDSSGSVGGSDDEEPEVDSENDEMHAHQVTILRKLPV